MDEKSAERNAPHQYYRAEEKRKGKVYFAMVSS